MMSHGLFAGGVVGLAARLGVIESSGAQGEARVTKAKDLVGLHGDCPMSFSVRLFLGTQGSSSRSSRRGKRGRNSAQQYLLPSQFGFVYGTGSWFRLFAIVAHRR